MSKELKITKERIKKLVAGLSSCPEAREAVEDAFPEAFEEKEEWVDITKDVRIYFHYTGSAYWIHLDYDGKQLSFMGYKEVEENFSQVGFRVEAYADAFHILKRK